MRFHNPTACARLKLAVELAVKGLGPVSGAIDPSVGSVVVEGDLVVSLDEPVVEECRCNPEAVVYWDFVDGAVRARGRVAWRVAGG